MLEEIRINAMCIGYEVDRAFHEMEECKGNDEEKRWARFQYKCTEAVFKIYWNLMTTPINHDDRDAVIDTLAVSRDTLKDYCDDHRGETTDDIEIANRTLRYYNGLIESLSA